jgi:hypothetical protein
MQGLAAVARSKTFLTFDLVSVISTAASLDPMYLFNSSGPLTVIHDNPNSDATADANNDLPHPGNPYSKMLLLLVKLVYPDLYLIGQDAKREAY